MKSLSRFSKGILTGLIVVMMLGLCPDFFAPASSLMIAPAAYAEQGDFDTVTADMKPAEPAPESAQVKDDMVKTATKMAAWSHRLFAPLINFFAFQIGNFLGTDYIYRGDMGKMLQKIWVISRNLVNISFVFILLWMALKEIFNVTGESEIKKNMIKFVLLLVAVNFSWLATKVVLDASNVVTHVVFAIPSGISNPPAYGQCEINNPDQPVKGTCYPTAVISPTDSGDTPPLYWEDKEGDNDNCSKVQEAYSKAYDAEGKAVVFAEGDANKEKYEKFQRRTSICMENLNLFKYDQNTAVIYLTYGMARIQNLVYAMGGTGQISQLTVSVLLSLVMQIAYTISLMALFIALIIRMAMLWFFVAFSPFMVLVMWFSNFGDQDLGEMKFGFQEFTRWAFVPAKVGAVFAVSFIMISAGQIAGVIKSTWVDNSNSKTGMTFQILEPQALFGGIGTIQNFIWLLMSIAILWVGVFGILSKMSIVSTVTNRINDYGKSVAKWVGTAPYWAPVLPLGKGGAKVAIKQVTQGVDIRKKLETLAQAEKEEEAVRRLKDRAKDARSVGEAYQRLDSGTMDQGMANKVARDFGFTDVAHMMQMDRKVLIDALKKNSQNKEGKESALLDELKKWAEKPKPAAVIQQEAQAKAQADAKAAQALGGQGAAPAPGQGPAAPKPPAAAK